MPIAQITAALLSAVLLAHDAYPADCCDGKDCRSVPCEEIQLNGAQGWRHGKSTFGANAVRQPIDNRCHVCKSDPFGRCIMFPLPKTS